MSRVPVGPVLRTTVKWLLLLADVGFVLFRLKFAPMPVAAHQVKPNTLVAEVMGTATLEARVQTTLSPRVQKVGLLTDAVAAAGLEVTGDVPPGRAHPGCVRP